MTIVKNEVVYDFKAKAIQSTPLENNRPLPFSHCYVTQAKLSTINSSNEVILKIIMHMDQNKAHRHDGMSIRMIKLCYKALLKPLSLLSNHFVESNKFSKN